MSSSRSILWAGAVVVTLVVVLVSLPDADGLTIATRSAANEAQQLEQRTATARDAADDQEAFAAELRAARQAVPREADLPELIDQIEAAVTASGMTWTAGAPTATTPEDGIDELTWRMSMTVVGTTDQLSTLLGDLQQLPRLLLIDSVSVQSTTGEQLNVTLSTRFFSTAGDPDAARIEADLADGTPAAETDTAETDTAETGMAQAAEGPPDD